MEYQHGHPMLYLLLEDWKYSKKDKQQKSNGGMPAKNSPMLLLEISLSIYQQGRFKCLG
jgi:hypothetical protein